MEYSWRDKLDQAIARNRRDAHHRYLQLATAGDGGYPANRTVVFRGFSDAGALKMVTDSRSAKAGQVAGHSGAEACWYFTRTREQFRIRGRLSLIDQVSPDASLRLAAWSGLSEAAREQFFWAHPGEPVSAEPANPDSDGGPPVHFLLMLLTPERIDHLCLAPTPQQRVISQVQGADWVSTPVNP